MKRIRITPKPKVTVTAEPTPELDLNQFNKKQLKNYNDAKGGKAGTDFASVVATDITAVNSRIDAIPQPADLSGYATKSELPDLSLYAKKSELPRTPDLSLYAKKSELPQMPSLSGLATEDFVAQSVKRALAGYVKNTELPALPNFSEFASHAAVGELLKGYVKTSQLPAPTDLSNYPTKSQVTEQINTAVASVSGPSGGVTETKVNELVNTALSGYATTDYVNSAVTGINYPTVDLSPYAKKSELPKIPDLTLYAKKSEIPPPGINRDDLTRVEDSIRRELVILQGLYAAIDDPHELARKDDLSVLKSQVVNQIPGVAVTAVKQDIGLNPDGLMKTIVDAVLAKIPSSGGGSSPYKEYEHRKVLRSSLKVTGAGNSQEWHVTFKKTFSEPPFVNICQFRDSRLVAVMMVYNITTTGFTFSSNYAGADTELAYEAYVPNS
jgi:hypothetical protein